MTLPTFEPNPFASAATESPRYIDAAFAVTKHGTGEQIEILDTSQDCDARRRARLDSLDRERHGFRPEIVDGELADSAPVVVRYHLGP